MDLNKLLKEKWPEVKKKIAENWPSITDDDLKQIDGNYELLVEKLRHYYAFGRADAENEITRLENETREEVSFFNPAVIQGILLGGILIATILFFLFLSYQEYQKAKMPQPIHQTITVPQKHLRPPAADA